MSLREAAQQALEALEDIADELISPYNDPIGKAILDLRTALAEPEQTFMAEYKFRTYGYYQDADGKMQVGEIPEEMLTVSAERTAQMIDEVTRTEPEPVAWMDKQVTPETESVRLTAFKEVAEAWGFSIPLYTRSVLDAALLAPKPGQFKDRGKK
jgi:hypothetical protein